MQRCALLVILFVATATQGGPHVRVPRFRGGRILNGVPAQPGEFPSQLSLQWHGSHNCGASIVSENWAVTASHCVVGDDPEDITLYDGSIDLESGGTVHDVVEIITHEGYNPGDSYINDIAVLRVGTPFIIDGVNVKPISLPEAGQNPPDGATATVIGWGETEVGNYPTILQKVDNDIVNQQQCDDAYESMGMDVHPGQICAAVPEGGKGDCYGDSGGPLFVDGTVVGLVSWANGCAEAGYPSVLTRVSYYRDWIKEKTGV